MFLVNENKNIIIEKISDNRNLICKKSLKSKFRRFIKS